jgi:energy-coupling factor transporter ATP-binding protein EcfA2
MSVARAKLRFADLEVEFVDRDRGIKQVYEFAEKGTWHPVVVFGPEGCGKSAWLRQATEILKEMEFDVIYIDPLRKEFATHTSIEEVVSRFSEAIANTTGFTPLKLADLVVYLANQLLKKWKRKRIALLVDEVFQAIGLDRAEAYVKTLLNTIEYPPEPYEKIVIIAATSEGFSRWRIGRHRWAWIMPMWNMSKKGFEELYDCISKRVSSPIPDLDTVWKLTGGNPDMLVLLYRAKWNIDKVVEVIAKSKGITKDFVKKWHQHLVEVVEDPDALMEKDFSKQFRNELIEKNLVVYDLYSRDPELWVDEPPPEKDPELGIGRYVAWQTPLYREAVKKALQGL